MANKIVHKTVTRDEQGRINGVFEEEIETPKDLTEKVTAKVVEHIQPALDKVAADKSATAYSLAQDVADAVVKKAEEVAETVVSRAIDRARAEIENFKRQEDADDVEDADEVDDEDDDDPVFASPAKEAADLERDEEALAMSVEQTAKAIASIVKELAKTAAMVDGIAHVLEECGGDHALMKRFFAIANETPLGPDHPFVQDPRLRVFRFPDSDAGHMSNETSAEHQDDDPDVATDQMALRPHHRRRQRQQDEMRSESGSEDFRDHQAPQADAVLMSEYKPRRTRTVKIRKRGLWSGS